MYYENQDVVCAIQGLDSESLMYERLALASPDFSEFALSEQQLFMPQHYEIEDGSVIIRETKTYSEMIDQTHPTLEGNGILVWPEQSPVSHEWSFTLDEIVMIRDPHVEKPRPTRWITYEPAKAGSIRKEGFLHSGTVVHCGAGNAAARSNSSYACCVSASDMGEIYALQWIGDKTKGADSEFPLCFLLFRTAAGIWHFISEPANGGFDVTRTAKNIIDNQSTEFLVTWTPAKRPCFSIDLRHRSTIEHVGIGSFSIYFDAPLRPDLFSGQSYVSGYTIIENGALLPHLCELAVRSLDWSISEADLPKISAGFEQALTTLNPDVDFAKPLVPGAKLQLPGLDEARKFADGKKPSPDYIRDNLNIFKNLKSTH